MEYSCRRLMRKYFAAKLGRAALWFAVVCVLCLVQIELFYGPWAGFAEAYPYVTGMLSGVDLAAFGISLGNLLTRLVTRFNYTGRLRRDLGRYIPEREAAEPYAVLDGDICLQLNPGAPLYLGDKWLLLPGHAMLRERLVGVFYEELRKSFLSNKVRLTVVDDRGEHCYLDTDAKLHPELFRRLAMLHPGATNADHSVLRGYWAQEGVDYRRLRLGNEAPVKVSGR